MDGDRFIRDVEPLAIEEQPLPTISQLIVDFITAEGEQEQELRQFVLDVSTHASPLPEDDRKRALDSVHTFVIPHVRQAFLSMDQTARTFVLDTKQHWLEALMIVERFVPTVEATRSQFEVAPALDSFIVKEEPHSRRQIRHRAFIFPLRCDRPEENEANRRAYTLIMPHAIRLHLGRQSTGSGHRGFLKMHVTMDDFEPLIQSTGNIVS